MKPSRTVEELVDSVGAVESDIEETERQLGVLELKLTGLRGDFDKLCHELYEAKSTG